MPTWEHLHPNKQALLFSIITSDFRIGSKHTLHDATILFSSSVSSSPSSSSSSSFLFASSFFSSASAL
jgi:hypothetical protein